MYFAMPTSFVVGTLVLSILPGSSSSLLTSVYIFRLYLYLTSPQTTYVTIASMIVFSRYSRHGSVTTALQTIVV